MKRIYVGNGKWFDPDKAEVFNESTWWNGNNHISKATGSQIHHQKLYKTAGKKWFLYEWSDYSKIGDSIEEVNHEFVANWMLKNEYTDFPVEIEDIVIENEV